jgi:hypothetical protein
MNLRAGELVGRIQDRDALDAKRGAVLGQKVRDRLRPNGRDRVRHQRDVRIVLGEEAAAGAGLVEQEHLVVAGDGHRRRGQHRAGIGHEQIDLVLGDELIVERRGGRGVALVVIGDQLDRDFLVERLHVDAALGVFLLNPEFQSGMNRHRDRGIAAGRSVERSELDFRWRIGGRGL